tara:strand:- start:153 stop:401 length:249 start_codon:yes stop_codon:yes gene_type:complete
MKETKILFFSSKSCAPCNLAKSQLTDEIINELNIEILDSSNWEKFVIHEVKSVPTFIKINLSSNKEVNRLNGYKNIEELRGL